MASVADSDTIWISPQEAMQEKLCLYCHQPMSVKQLNLSEACRMCFNHKCCMPVVDTPVIEYIKRSFADMEHDFNKAANRSTSVMSFEEELQSIETLFCNIGSMLSLQKRKQLEKVSCFSLKASRAPHLPGTEPTKHPSDNKDTNFIQLLPPEGNGLVFPQSENNIFNVNLIDVGINDVTNNQQGVLQPYENAATLCPTAFKTECFMQSTSDVSAVTKHFSNLPFPELASSNFAPCGNLEFQDDFKLPSEDDLQKFLTVDLKNQDLNVNESIASDSEALCDWLTDMVRCPDFQSQPDSHDNSALINDDPEKTTHISATFLGLDFVEEGIRNFGYCEGVEKNKETAIKESIKNVGCVVQFEENKETAVEGKVENNIRDSGDMVDDFQKNVNEDEENDAKVHIPKEEARDNEKEIIDDVKSSVEVNSNDMLHRDLSNDSTARKEIERDFEILEENFTQHAKNNVRCYRRQKARHQPNSNPYAGIIKIDCDSTVVTVNQANSDIISKWSDNSEGSSSTSVIECSEYNYVKEEDSFELFRGLDSDPYSSATSLAAEGDSGKLVHWTSNLKPPVNTHDAFSPSSGKNMPVHNDFKVSKIGMTPAAVIEQPSTTREWVSDEKIKRTKRPYVKKEPQPRKNSSVQKSSGKKVSAAENKPLFGFGALKNFKGAKCSFSPKIMGQKKTATKNLKHASKNCDLEELVLSCVNDNLSLKVKIGKESAKDTVENTGKNCDMEELPLSCVTGILDKAIADEQQLCEAGQSPSWENIFGMMN